MPALVATTVADEADDLDAWVPLLRPHQGHGGVSMLLHVSDAVVSMGQRHCCLILKKNPIFPSLTFMPHINNSVPNTSSGLEAFEKHGYSVLNHYWDGATVTACKAAVSNLIKGSRRKPISGKIKAIPILSLIIGEISQYRLMSGVPDPGTAKFDFYVSVYSDVFSICCLIRLSLSNH